ncbi:hypothetical protein WJS89_00510 [Sphingomicrobium sp. XHP0235]|uniref:hypothetical protein n=1 Tax=Sphingomicrobium aquimarinum TaxID=3133971 RepID=UPI0031FF1CB5
MTDKAELSGEDRARRRSRFLFALKAASFVIGLAVGLVLVWYGDLPDPEPSDRLIVGIVTILGFLILSPVLTFLWWRRLDEVDRLDQLWAGSIGFLTYITGFALLLVTEELGLTQDGPVLAWQEFPLFLLSFLAAAATLLARKLLNRF